jgi:acyl-coenzyme A synthetase/AMP-(fatty) acid ligase
MQHSPFTNAEGYGQTETTLLCGTFKKMNKWVKPGSIGKAAPGYDVRIVNNMGKEVPRGEQAGGHTEATLHLIGTGTVPVRISTIITTTTYKKYR